jgi:hypothetical protein
MTAKQYLSQIRRIKMRVAALSEQLACMKEVAGLASSVLSDIPHSPNRNIHKLENEVIKQIEWEEKIQSELGRLEEVNSTIAAVADPTLQTLLVKRYVNGETWEKIASDMYISIRHVYRFHDEALALIEKTAVNATQTKTTVPAPRLSEAIGRSFLCRPRQTERPRVRTLPPRPGDTQTLRQGVEAYPRPLHCSAPLV